MWAMETLSLIGRSECAGIFSLASDMGNRCAKFVCDWPLGLMLVPALGCNPSYRTEGLLLKGFFLQYDEQKEGHLPEFAEDLVKILIADEKRPVGW